MLFNGFYINLDESPQRHHAMQARLKALGLDGMTRRFAGQRGDGRPTRISASQLGCFLSHQAVLEQAPADRFTLVLEDDAAWPPPCRGACRRCWTRRRRSPGTSCSLARPCPTTAFTLWTA